MVALARRIGWGLAIVVGLLIATTILTARTGDPALWPPAAGSPTVEILVVSHGYHSGLALPRALVADVAERHGRSALIAVAQRFAAYPWIEVGWGDEGFYRSVPDAASFALALRACSGRAPSRRCTWWGYPPRRVRSFRTERLARWSSSSEVRSGSASGQGLPSSTSCTCSPFMSNVIGAS